jgi:hypothetical protein
MGSGDEGGKGGGIGPPLLLNLSPRPGFSVADARAADHLVLRRIVAVKSLHSKADALHLIPNRNVEALALILQANELCFEVSDLQFHGLDLIHLSRECRGVERTEPGERLDLCQPGQDASCLCEQVMWIEFFGHRSHSLMY